MNGPLVGGNSAQLATGTEEQHTGRGPVREDSAEAHLFKLLIRDLSTGGVVRQQRETDGYGNFVKKESARRGARSMQVRSATMKSAFDDSEQYVLTDLGRQFVHYAMNELAPRITFQSGSATA